MNEKNPTKFESTPLNTAEIKRRSIKGVFSFVSRTLLLNVIALAAMFIISGKLSAADFAVYGIVTQLIGLLIFVSDVGLAAALVQKRDEPTQDEYRGAFTVQQILSWVIVLVCFILMITGVISAKVGSVGNWILMALAISFPLASLKTIPSILLERRLEYGKVVIPQIYETLVFNVILIWLALNNWGAMSYTYAILGRSIVGVVSMYLIQPWRIGFSINRATLKLLPYGIKFQLNDLLARIKDQFFYLAMGYWLPLPAFGYVIWARTWSNYPYSLTVQNVLAITFPTFARLQQHPELLAKAIDKSLYFIALITFPLLVGMCFLLPSLVELVPAYQKWQPAFISLWLFAFNIGIAAVTTPIINVLNAVGKIGASLKYMSMWTILTWVITPVLVWKLGFVGIPLASALIGLTSILPILYVRKLVSYHPWQSISTQLCAAFIMGLALWYRAAWWGSSYTSFALAIVVGCVAYGGAVLLIGGSRFQRELKSVLIR